MHLQGEMILFFQKRGAEKRMRLNNAFDTIFYFQNTPVIFNSEWRCTTNDCKDPEKNYGGPCGSGSTKKCNCCRFFYFSPVDQFSIVS